MNQNGRIPCCLGRWRSIWAASRIPWSETGSCSAPTPCVSVSSAPWARPTASPSSLSADSASFHPSGAPSSSSLTRRPRWRPTSGRASRPVTPTKTTACRCDQSCPFCVSRSNPTPEIMQGTMHAGEEGHARPGWTTSRRGQDSPWKSQSEWQRTGVNGESMSMVWPTLGSRTAKEQNRTNPTQPISWLTLPNPINYRWKNLDPTQYN